MPLSFNISQVQCHCHLSACGRLEYGHRFLLKERIGLAGIFLAGSRRKQNGEPQRQRFGEDYF